MCLRSCRVPAICLAKLFISPVGGAAVRRTDLLLLLLDAHDRRPVAGLTRLVKLLFLAQMEVLPDEPLRTHGCAPFDFVAHRFGPFTFDIYDEIEFLKSVGMADDSNGQYRATDKGRRFVEQRLRQRIPADQIEGIKALKIKYCYKDLEDLLHYVYTKYPAYTVRSEILDRVLTRK